MRMQATGQYFPSAPADVNYCKTIMSVWLNYKLAVSKYALGVELKYVLMKVYYYCFDCWDSKRLGLFKRVNRFIAMTCHSCNVCQQPGELGYM